MVTIESQSAASSRPRWYRPTPGRLLPVLLAVEGFLWLSERFRWFPFNQQKGWTVLIAIASVGVFLLLMLGWFFLALIFRLRFQFSILSLLLLMVVVAIPCSWLATEIKWAQEQREVVAEIARVGRGVEYDWQTDSQGVYRPNAKPPAPAWLRRLLGDDLFATVTEAYTDIEGGYTPIIIGPLPREKVTDALVERLEGLRQLRRLDLYGADVSDAGMEHFKRLTQLQSLGLSGTKITDAGLECVEGLTQLQSLALNFTIVTDAGLKHLEGLRQLKTLGLSGTKITDAGLEYLKGLTRLKVLYLRNTRVTGTGLERLTGLPQLVALDLTATQITDAGLEHLKGLTRPRDRVAPRHEGDQRGGEEAPAGIAKLRISPLT